MPYKIIWVKKGCIVRFFDSFTLLENVEANAEVFDDLKSRDMKFAVWNLSSVKESNLTRHLVSTISHNSLVIAQRIKLEKLAIVSRDEEIWEFAKDYCIKSYANGISWKISLFHDLDEAEKWIGSPLK